ncbi:molecular chaperone MKKS isoform X2 [Clinocottus analis]|uniref:molecular chaperone MKKS isoform X2 n=1 Tax=Clinocottus analis TaxID=304258 RepID=UPI0035C0EF32
MSRLVKKSPSVCTDLPLDNTDICNKLHLLRQLLKSCFGPTGRLKQVHNNIGGHVVTTSTSSVLLPAISSSQPFINLIKTSILNHVSRFSDCGLFAAVLCLSLIEHATRSGLSGSVAIRVNTHLLGLCTSYLQREDCGCKVKLDFCSSHSLVALARGVISSKPACALTEQEALHVSKLAVRAFLLTVPCQSPGEVTLGKIVTVSVEGHPVLNSAVFPGLLVDAPDVLRVDGLESPLSHPLRVVLFSASLAGDLAELGDGTIEVHPGADTDLQILDQLLELGKRVVKDEVKLCACQKVVHPVVQQYLKSHGVVVIERLGITLMEPFAQLTGARPVATLHTTIPAGAYGQVACQKTEHVLRLTLREPSALLGGGCTETHLAAYIRHESTKEVPETVSALGCSQTEHLRGVDSFCRSLESVAAALEHDGGDSLMDLTHAHRWTHPADLMKGHMGEESSSICGCGLMESSPNQRWTYLNANYPHFSPAPPSRDAAVRPRVLDSFTAKVNALQVAVETANLALDVRYLIQDMN